MGFFDFLFGRSDGQPRGADETPLADRAAELVGGVRNPDRQRRVAAFREARRFAEQGRVQRSSLRSRIEQRQYASDGDDTLTWLLWMQLYEAHPDDFAPPPAETSDAIATARQEYVELGERYEQSMAEAPIVGVVDDPGTRSVVEGAAASIGWQSSGDDGHHSDSGHDSGGDSGASCGGSSCGSSCGSGCGGD